MPGDLFNQIYGPVAAPTSGAPVPTSGTSGSMFSDIYGTAPTPTAEEGFFTPLKTAAGAVFEVLNRPSRAVAESALALKHGEPVLPAVGKALSGNSTASFEDYLSEEGMQPGLKRTLAGLGLDIATDPLNLVGGLPFKAVKALDKLPAIEKAAQGIKDIPLVRAAGERFIPHFNLPEDYSTARRLLDSEISARRGEAFETAIRRFKDVNPDEAKQITLAMEQPAGHIGVEKLDNLVTEQRAAFAAQKDKEIAAKVLDPDKVVDDYVTYLFKTPVSQGGNPGLRRTLSAKNPFANTRDLDSIKQALYLGAEPHIARIAAVRAASGDRAIAVANFFQKAVRDFSVPKEAAEAGMRTVNAASDMPIKEIFKNRYFDPDVAADLEKLAKPAETRDALDNAFRVATGVWKGYATAVNPGFHVRNLASNIFNSWLGGMSLTMAPVRYAEAAAWGAGHAKAIAGHTAEDIAKAMTDMGVVGTGHGAFGEVNTALDQLTSKTQSKLATAIETVNPLSRFNIIQQSGRTVGQTVEDLSRRALFLDQLHKGKSLEDAAMHVRKYLFDYGELTDFERKIRDYAVPFYTWLRKNLPLQMESVLSQPEKFAHTGKVINAIEGETKKEGLTIPAGERPEWLQAQNAIQLPVTTSTGEKVLLNPDLPFQDLNVLPADALSKGQPGEAGTDFLRTVLSMTNPLIKVPSELALNREAYTQREIVPEEIGPDAVVKAPAHLALLAAHAPEFAAKLGMHKSVERMTGKEQWVMPARAAYLANQIPFLTKLGRVSSTTEADQQGSLPIPGTPYKLQPRQLSILGFGVTPMDETKQARATVSRLRRGVQQTRNLNRQNALFQEPTPTSLDEILRLVLRGQLE